MRSGCSLSLRRAVNCGQEQEVQTIVQDRYCSISVCVEENIDEAYRTSWIRTGNPDTHRTSWREDENHIWIFRALCLGLESENEGGRGGERIMKEKKSCPTTALASNTHLTINHERRFRPLWLIFAGQQQTKVLVVSHRRVRASR